MRLWYWKSRQRTPVILGDRARDAGQWEIAAAYYRTALAENRRDSAIWVQYGHSLKESGNLVAAEAAYRRAIEDHPTAGDPYLQLGHVLKLQDKIEEAKSAYLDALSRDSSLTDAAVEATALGHREERSFAQIKLHSHEKEQRPRRRAKLTRISNADRARELGQWAVAARLYREALDHNPDRPPIWLQYGHMLRALGQLAAAESAYRRAIPGNPTAAPAYKHLGDVLKTQGKHDEAEAAYLRALAIDPAFSQVLTELETLGWPTDRLTEVQRLAAGKGTSLDVA